MELASSSIPLKAPVALMSPTISRVYPLLQHRNKRRQIPLSINLPRVSHSGPVQESAFKIVSVKGSAAHAGRADEQGSARCLGQVVEEVVLERFV